MTAVERLQESLEALSLSAVEARLESLLEQAAKNEPSYGDFLLEVLTTEVDARRQRYLKTRLQLAHLPYVKTFDQFDFAFQPSIDERQIRELRTLRFIHDASNVILLGPPGVGKTHLAVALAESAIRAGQPAYFMTAHDLVDDLGRAYREGRLDRRMKVYLAPKVLIIDEMGYLPLDDLGATIFFQLVSARYERGSIILTSNKSYGDWGAIFGDPIIATAILDRLLHHSTTINIRGESYRLKDRRRAGLLPSREQDGREPAAVSVAALSATPKRAAQGRRWAPLRAQPPKPIRNFNSYAFGWGIFNRYFGEFQPVLTICARASTLSSTAWVFPGEFRERFHMSEAVVSGVLMHTLRGGVRTVNGREVTSNIARLRIDRVFQGKVPARELQFVWYSLHWPNTRMGVIYSGPPLAAFEAGKRYLISLKRRGLGWEVAMPLYELDVELAPELPPAAPRDLSLLSPQHRYESVAEELEAAAFAQPAPATGTTGNAAATFPWVFDLLGGCAEPSYRHFVSVPSPELREAASGWLKFVQSRALPCEASDTSRKRQ